MSDNERNYQCFATAWARSSNRVCGPNPFNQICPPRRKIAGGSRLVRVCRDCARSRAGRRGRYNCSCNFTLATVSGRKRNRSGGDCRLRPPGSRFRGFIVERFLAPRLLPGQLAVVRRAGAESVFLSACLKIVFGGTGVPPVAVRQLAGRNGSIGSSQSTRLRLLSTVAVGGSPTGAGESPALPLFERRSDVLKLGWAERKQTVPGVRAQDSFSAAASPTMRGHDVRGIGGGMIHALMGDDTPQSGQRVVGNTTPHCGQTA